MLAPDEEPVVYCAVHPAFAAEILAELEIQLSDGNLRMKPWWATKEVAAAGLVARARLAAPNV